MLPAGVPHDRFAMTTRGVRAYVTGLQAKLHGAATGTVGGKPEGRRLTKAITGAFVFFMRLAECGPCQQPHSAHSAAPQCCG